MRTSRLLASVAFGLFFVHSAAASAMEPPQAEEDSIGTTPARNPQAAPAAPVATGALEASDERMEVDMDPSRERRSYRRGEAPIAKDPPPDWAVLHAGLRPELGTFGGIATLALAHARTERFYGVFSLSAVRNDAGTHVGAAQLALGRNLSDEFIGGMQVSLTENRARTFSGIGQTGLAYNRAGDMTGVFQLAAFNRATSFTGATQLGLYNRTDKAFTGIAEIGTFNHARTDFTGALQIGVVNGVGREMFSESSSNEARFGGIAQVGVVNAANNFYGVAQIGAASFVGGKFGGLVQIGALGAAANEFKGLAQIGVASVSEKSIGLQLGAGAVSLEQHDGLQIGALGNYAQNIRGAQLGIVNVAREVKGVQVGVFNHTRRLRGLQIGLANHAEDGVLPWTAILNFGFGDEDDASNGEDEEYRSARR